MQVLGNQGTARSTHRIWAAEGWSSALCGYLRRQTGVAVRLLFKRAPCNGLRKNYPRFFCWTPWCLFGKCARGSTNPALQGRFQGIQQKNPPFSRRPVQGRSSNNIHGSPLEEECGLGTPWDSDGELRDETEIRGLHQPLDTDTYPGSLLCHLFFLEEVHSTHFPLFDKK